MNKSFAHICLIVSFLGMTMAFTDSAVGKERALASGYFDCKVLVFDSDPPIIWNAMHFTTILGIIGGPVQTGTVIGTGSGLDAICEEQTKTIRSLAQNQMCTVSAIQKLDDVQTGLQWTFNVLCDSKKTNVIDAIGNILEGVLITPIAAP